MGYQFKWMICCVFFMNEENGLCGGRAYWKWLDEQKEYYMVVIEFDWGGFILWGFMVDGYDEVFIKKFKWVIEWIFLFVLYGLDFEKGGFGVDIFGFKS